MAMNEKKIISMIILLSILIVGAIFAARFLSGNEDLWICENGQWAKHGNPASPQPSGGCGTQIPSVSANQLTSPSPSALANTNIKLDSPKKDDQVSLPILVEGSARVFENVVSFRVKDSTGSLLFEGTGYANAPDAGQFGLFQKSIDFLVAKSKTPDIVLDVFWNSPADGSELDMISVPLKIDLTNTIILKSFFGNQASAVDCNKVVSVDRVVQKTTSPARRALEVTLHGPILKEAGRGYLTNIPPDVIINSLNIENGVAKVDFNEILEKDVGGSCRISAIRAQITQTLKQFLTVKEVTISINGRVEGILQP